jgi:histidinol-phosphate aminotransferase
MEFNVDNLVRENIKKMTPYSSARHEFSGTATILLDANEN